MVAGGSVETGKPSIVPRGNIEGVLNKELVVDAAQVLSVVNTGSAQLCDARSAARFNGEVAEPRQGLVSGHIPGSLNIPHELLTLPNDPSTFKSLTELRQIVNDAGLIQGARTIVLCGSGVTSAKISFAMYLLGWPIATVPVYDGSWTEWGQIVRRDLPKVTKND